MTSTSAPAAPVLVTGWAQVREALRNHDLAQALYDAGGLVMKDSLITLHGPAHRQRRRVENRLFRRGTFRHWELDLVPGIVEEGYAPALAAGRGDLVRIGRRTIMRLTARIAGVDLPQDAALADTLEDLVRVFSEGATAVHSTRDPAALAADVAAAMATFDTHFLAPSRARREALLADLAAGRAAEDDLPRDVLTALLRHGDELGLPPEAVRREVAFYLQAGSHSTANLFTHAAHAVFGRLDDPGFAARTGDLRFLQRCVHETLRLHPASPVAWRRAATEVTLPGGLTVPEGTLVELDLLGANTDPAVWGPNADRFDPDRTPPPNVPAWGHSFGGGMHACIGMELDGGVAPSAEDDEPVFGTVTLMLQALLQAGARPDPADPPVVDTTTSRKNFARYPVVLTR